jgi:hypothetical protein
MRSFRFSRPLRFYLLFIGLPLIVISGALSGLYFWQQQQPDLRPIAWHDLKPDQTLRTWQHIVLHHSDTVRGSTAGIDHHHREVNGWDGIGYQFVIGNGHGMRNGRIEYTFRWNLQREGAHAGGKDKSYNEQGIGICLIGDFEQTFPAPFQIKRAVALCACLIESLPALNSESIIGHKHVPGKQTKCPGRYFNIFEFRYLVEQELERRQRERERERKARQEHS